MNKFTKGYIYIVSFNRNWYIVRQESQRTWVALNFTHVDVKEGEVSFKGNGVDLYAEMEKVASSYAYPLGVYSYNNNAKFREAMFSVLKTGAI